jgi:hypothetical protein
MDATSAMSDSSVDSSDSYNGDDARCFLWEWRMDMDHYSKMTQESGGLKTHLRVIEVALHAVEEETSTA